MKDLDLHDQNYQFKINKLPQFCFLKKKLAAENLTLC